MKIFLLTLCIPILNFGFVSAQTPYEWNFFVQNKTEGIAEIHCKINITSPWHIYSLFTPEGGPMPTKLSFVRNPLFILDGKPEERGKLITRHETVFGVDVLFFEGEVDFIQRIKLKSKAKTNIGGTVEFMVCNKEQCLPPAKQNFTLSLR